MKLKDLLNDLAKDNEIKKNKANVNVAMLFTHDENNSIGIFPYSCEGNPVQVVEYLCQDFLEECEILLMYQALKDIKSKNEKLYDECIAVLNQKNYKHLGEVIDRLYSSLEEEVA